MKRTIIVISLLWLVVNLLLGMLLSAYSWINVAASSVVIIATTLLLWLTNFIMMKDAFKVSLTILFILIGLMEYGIACFMPQHFEDNWGVISIVILIAIQVAVLFITSVTSKKIN